MCSKQMSVLFQYPGVHSHHFYIFQGEEATKARSMTWCVTVLTDRWSLDVLNRTDVIWSSSEAEDMEAAMSSIVEATS